MLETIRDIAIILLAFLNIILVLLLIVLAYFVLRLVRLLQGDVPAVFDTVKRTLTTVERTTSYIGKTSVMPIVRASSAVAAASRFAQVMLGMNRPRGR